MPLPVMAADSSLDSAVTSGSTGQTGDAITRLLADTTAKHGDAIEHDAQDENPSGWETAGDDPTKSASETAPAATVTPTAPQAPAVEATPESPKASTETTPAPVAVETKAEPVAVETKTEPVAVETKTEPVAVETKTEPVAVETKTEPVAVETPAAQPTAEATNGDGKQIADTAGAKGEPVEVRGDDSGINKDGIGGFVGEDGDGQVALLEKGFVEQGVRETLGEVIVIDNDEAVEMETIPYEELPTDEGKTKIRSGAQFPVVMSSQLNSKNNKKGDTLQARLKYDLKIGDRLVAEKGSMVTGHIHYNLPARSVMHSLVTPKRWYKNSGVIGITFDEIINEKKEHIALNARPARKSRIVKNKAEGRELGVNDVGEITGPWGQQLKYKAVRIGLNFALAPAGVFTFGAMPVALGVMGAVNPSFAFMKPVGTNVRHRRIKGFAWGFLSGVPGSWIIEDTVTKGQECIIKPGDEFLVELKQEFTGEARSEATLMPGSNAKVRGQVVSDPKEKSKKKK